MAEIIHPPEAVLKTSMIVVIAGFVLLTSIVILAFTTWASRGEKNSQPDVMGVLVSLYDVLERDKSAWFPGKFWPTNEADHSRKDPRGSPIIKAMWMFLISWFVCASVYLIFAGAIVEIEVFREERHLRAAAFVAAAFVLCSLWPIMFRIGSVQLKKGSPIVDPDETSTDQTNGEKATKAKKLFFLWLSCGILVIAAGFAVTGSAILRAWTLPGPQYGTLLFLGPGYGLFAGWLLFAAALNMSTAISYSSFGYAGTNPQPRSDTAFTYRGSLWPPFMSLVISAISVFTQDPAMPLPMLLSVFLFTPRITSHLVASFVCVVGIVVASLLVVLHRM